MRPAAAQIKYKRPRVCRRYLWRDDAEIDAARIEAMKLAYTDNAKTLFVPATNERLFGDQLSHLRQKNGPLSSGPLARPVGMKLWHAHLTVLTCRRRSTTCIFYNPEATSKFSLINAVRMKNSLGNEIILSSSSGLTGDQQIEAR